MQPCGTMLFRTAYRRRTPAGGRRRAAIGGRPGRASHAGALTAAVTVGLPRSTGDGDALATTGSGEAGQGADQGRQQARRAGEPSRLVASVTRRQILEPPMTHPRDPRTPAGRQRNCEIWCRDELMRSPSPTGPAAPVHRLARRRPPVADRDHQPCARARRGCATAQHVLAPPWRDRRDKHHGTEQAAAGTDRRSTGGASVSYAGEWIGAAGLAPVRALLAAAGRSAAAPDAEKALVR